MPDQTGTIISILGFYLSLISILGSLFYVHLGAWVKQIQTTQQKWKQYKNLSDDPEGRAKKIECYFEAFDEKNMQPAFGFILLTLFMVIIGWFAKNLRSLLPDETSLGDFLYIPGYAFFTIYMITSLSYILYGYHTSNKIYKDIDEQL